MGEGVVFWVAGEIRGPRSRQIGAGFMVAHRSTPGRRAFTLIELLVVIAIVSLLMSMLMTAVVHARKTARMLTCMNNMSVMGKTVETYGSVFGDRVYTFSWRKNTKQSQWSDLNNHNNDDLVAASDQAVDILRRRADRPDFPKLTNWLPHIANTHLVLLDFLNARLPDPQVLCPEDRYRIAWGREPDLFQKKMVIPYPGGPFGAGSAFGNVWPYSASYNNVMASSERSVGGIFQGTQLLYYYYPGLIKMGGNKLSDVTFPSQKVLTTDTIQRHYGKQATYWGYDDVRIPLTFFDASVRIKLVGESNLGWNPTKPEKDKPLIFDYKPDKTPSEQVWEPPTRSGNNKDPVFGRFLWTRGGLKGIDFGGGEINTGQTP